MTHYRHIPRFEREEVERAVNNVRLHQFHVEQERRLEPPKTKAWDASCRSTFLELLASDLPAAFDERLSELRDKQLTREIHSSAEYRRLAAHSQGGCRCHVCRFRSQCSVMVPDGILNERNCDHFHKVLPKILVQLPVKKLIKALGV